MSRHFEIAGIVFRPCSLNQKDSEKTWMSTDYSTNKDFLQSYNNHIAAMQIVAGCAKHYILKNWKKVKDWTNLNVIIVGNTGKATEYYNYVERVERPSKNSQPDRAFDKIVKKIDKENKRKHNPVKTIDKVVLDPTDSDFSIVINEKQHMWIDDESVIMIANYIEETLNKKKNENN